MFKILVIKSLYGLSDEQAQFQIPDRRSFHHFLGLSEAVLAPDHNTIREFREKLTQAELFGELFAAFNARLAGNGFITRKGIAAYICEKDTRGHGLTQRQKRSTRAKSRRRACVEHIFGFMTGSKRALFQRCIGFVSNRSRILLANPIYNMARTERIIRLKL